jgi:hypothetical protein
MPPAARASDEGRDQDPIRVPDSERRARAAEHISGTERLLEDGTRISIREESSSEGTTIDIWFPDRPAMKVHLPKDGEQPQQEPVSELGFWNTVGGIAIGALGGIAWVGEKATHPFR